MKTAWSICMVVALVVPFTVSAADAPLSDKLPASTMLYVGWAGTQNNAFQGSMFGQLLQEPAARKIWDSFQKAANQSPDLRAVAGLALAEFLAKHPVAVAVTDVQIKDNSFRFAPIPKVVLLVDLGKDKRQFAETLDLLLGFAPDLADHCVEATVGGQAFTVFQPEEDVTFAWGYEGNLFIVGINGGEKDVVGIKQADSLAAAKPFAAAMKAVAPSPAQCAYFVDIKRVVQMVDAWEQQHVVDIQSGESAPQVQKSLGALGLEKVTMLVGAMSVADKGLLSRCKIFSPAPHRGLLAVFNGKPLTPADLAALPADSDFACMARVDLANILARIKEIGSVLTPDAVEQINAGLNGIRQETGIDVEKDLLASLGDTWSLTMAPSQGGMFTGVCATVSIKDAKKLQETIDKIETLVRKEREFAMGLSRIDRAKFGEMDVRYVSMPVMPIAPAWGIYKDRLYVALWPQVVASAARTSGEQPGKLTDHKGFAAGLSHMSPKPMYVSFVNTPQLIRPFYGAAMIGWTMTMSYAQNMGLSPADLPTMGQIEKYLWPSVSAISLDDGGLMFESYSSLP